MDFRSEIIGLLVESTGLEKKDVETQLSVPPSAELGDFAFPCFTLKTLSSNPKEAAEKLKLSFEERGLPDFVKEIKTAGPYCNFYLNPSIVAEKVLEEIYVKKEKYGSGSKGKKIVVEYCGPNTNKPLHLGHVRNMTIGNVTCRLLEFQGNKVHPVNIINDRGIHICQSMLAYQKWGEGKNPDKKGDHFVGDYYVLFAQKSKENPELQGEAQKMLVEWENGDSEVRALWKKMNTWVLKGFAETYKRFGIDFEKEYYESELYEKGREVAYEGLEKGVLIKNDEKAIIAPLEKFGFTDKVVLRADGTTVYITQDMYLAEERYNDFAFDKMIYVVASEQKMHFQQLFMILELLERPFAKNLYHLSYGLVNLPSGRMKSREGTVIDADDIMDEMSGLAEKEVRKRYDSLSEEEIKRRAEFIGLAAIRFFMSKTDAVRDIVFNPEESLSFEGETGPYIQYTHARACSILRKVKEEKQIDASKKVNFSLLKEESELKVLSLLREFPAVAWQAAEQYKIHLICRYVVDLAQAFNEFYHSCQVMSDEIELMKARMLLVSCVKQVLANGLGLLGITAPENM